VSAAGFVRVTEVGPRDGLQNERTTVPVEEKVAFVDALVAAGFPEVEVTSFVSPKWVPQLADAAEVMARVRRRAGTQLSVLVPNEKGLEGALAARADKVSVFVSASEGFSLKNVNASVQACLERLAPVVRQARAAGLPVRGYVSCVVRCPYDGPTPPDAVRSVVERLLALGVDEIDLGETLGVAEPDDIARMYGAVARAVDPGRTTLHLHDSNGRALDNARAALALGVRSFDSSAGGLGGCPYAPGARGNVDTLALAAMLDADGYETGVDRAAVERAISSIRHALRPAAS